MNLNAENLSPGGDVDDERPDDRPACSTCGLSLDEPPCSRNPATGDGHHTTDGGCAAAEERRGGVVHLWMRPGGWRACDTAADWSGSDVTGVTCPECLETTR